MRLTKWLLKKTVFFLFFLPIMLIATVAFLVYTTAGVYIGVACINLFTKHHITINSVHGSIAEHISIEHLLYSKNNLQLSLDHFEASQPFRELMNKHLKMTATFQTGVLSFQDNSLMELNKGKFEAKGSLSKPYSIQGSLQAFYKKIPLHTTIQVQEHNIHVRSLLKQNSLTVDKTTGHPWQIEANLREPNLLHPALQNLQSLISIKGNITDISHGQLTLSLSKGHINSFINTLEQFKFKETLDFEGGQCIILLAGHELKAHGDLTLDANKKIKASLELPDIDRKNANFATQKMQGSLHFDMDSLAFLNGLDPEITQINGQLEAELSLKGLIIKPDIKGKVLIKNASATLKSPQMTLKPIEFTLKTHEKKWEASASLLHNDKELKIQGNGEFYPNFKGSISLTGTELPILNSPEYYITATPKLNVEIKDKTIALSGNILIPKAHIKPQNVTDTVSLSEDVVFVKEEKIPKATPLPLTKYHINTQIMLEMGSEVEVAVKGLKGFLTGTVRFNKSEDKPLIANGELHIRDGIYKAYGQDMTITEGQLLFKDEDVDNPEIRLRAVRQLHNATNTVAASNRLLDFRSDKIQTLNLNNKTTLGIEVKGRLHANKVTLFSIPANLSQADILSLLLLGKPASQASSSEGGAQLLMAAVSSFNKEGGSQGPELLSQLKQSLGIDFNVEENPLAQNDGKKKNKNTDLVIGKALSKRLYLSYNMGLSQQDNNKATLKYLLNQFFSLQVNANTSGASGIDLLFTHQKD